MQFCRASPLLSYTIPIWYIFLPLQSPTPLLNIFPPSGRLVFALGHWALGISEADYSPSTIAISGAVGVLVSFTLLSSFAAKIVAAVFPEHIDHVATLQSLCNTVLVYMKVICILICELACWPFMCGMMVDRAAMAVFNTPVALRVHQARESLEWFLLLHWGLGATVLTFMSWSLVMARRTLRPEVMWFLRDPDDPAFDPLREIIVVTVPRHVLRFFVSTLLYGPFVFATIVLPLLVAQHANMLPLAPPQGKVWLLSLFDDSIAHVSLDFSLSQAFLEALASLAAAWLFSSLWKWNNQPFIGLLRSWSRCFGGWLGLTDWLLPCDGSREGTLDQPKVPLLQLRLLVFVTVSFVVLAAVPTFIFNASLALSIAFISPYSTAQCPAFPLHPIFYHSSKGPHHNSSCSIPNAFFAADPRSFVVPPDKSLRVGCACVIFCAVAAAGSPSSSLLPLFCCIVLIFPFSATPIVSWAVEAARSREWLLMRWSAKLECFGSVLGAAVRWTSCLVSYCVVAPYFLCYLVFVGGTSLFDADESCAAHLPIVTESLWSISQPILNATLPLTPPSISSFHLRPQIFNLIHLLCGILFFSLPESFFLKPCPSA